MRDSHHWLQKGERVGLRALTMADVPKWYGWFNSAEVTEHINKGIFPNTEEAQIAYFKKLGESRSDVQLGIALAGAEELIGVIGLHQVDWIHRRGDISIVIGEPSAWGKGFATEAIGLMVRHGFEKMNLHKITAGMWASNEGSKIAFEKCGFVLEATLRESYFYKGRYVDEYRLGLLQKDWVSPKQ